MNNTNLRSLSKLMGRKEFWTRLQNLQTSPYQNLKQGSLVRLLRLRLYRDKQQVTGFKEA